MLEIIQRKNTSFRDKERAQALGLVNLQNSLDEAENIDKSISQEKLHGEEPT